MLIVESTYGDNEENFEYIKEAILLLIRELQKKDENENPI